ncbi:hypothetical protein HN615_01560 [Candidatus Woesearchaeota archaeon]|jgi:hypothetical protein|nr:hypothetical protein [Candidatus Woesearchaeota archaeon]
MHKELHTIKVIRDYMTTKGDLPKHTENIDSVYKFFKEIEKSKKFNSLYILNYIYNYISCDEVSKRKTSSRVFEDLLAIIFNGSITDELNRENDVADVPEYFENVRDKIAGNKREKIDLLFNGMYGISVKTLVGTNSEINLGSFEKKVLFDGLSVEQYLTERQASNKEKVGLGSRKQLLKLFKLLQKEGLYQKFSRKFIQMYEYIFSDDMILGIKKGEKLTLYFFTGGEFTDLVTSRAENPENLLEVVNRWEGNSIRINRVKLLESASRQVQLNFDVLDETVIKLVNDFDFKLHKTYVDYCNNEKSGDILKMDLIKDLDGLFDKFETEEGLR